MLTVEEKNPSDVSLTLDSVSSGGGVIQFTTLANCVNYVFGKACNGCGEIYFYVTFTEVQSHPVTSQQTEPLNLGWGDQLVVNNLQSGWTVAISLFNGQTLECAAGTPCRDPNGYISGTYNGSALTLSSLDPSTVLGG